MIMRSSELIFRDHPLTAENVKKFADAIEAGEAVPTIVRMKKWTSNSNFQYVEKPCRVIIAAKYPHIAEVLFESKQLTWEGEKTVTLRDTLSWAQLVIGYLRCSGMIRVTEEDLPASGTGRKKAA